MEIKVEKTAFKKAVSSVRKALSKVAIQEERSHILCRVKESVLTLMATNNDLKSLSRIPISENVSNKDFSFTVDPKIIEKLFAKIDIDIVRMQFNTETHVLKVFTTDSEKSFTSLQSFDPERMLTFSEDIDPSSRKYTVNRAVLLFTLNYSQNFLSGPKDDQKQYDFILLNGGITFSANGMNKMGFVIFKNLESVTNYKIRKLVVPSFISFIENMTGPEVVLFETDKDYGVSSVDSNTFYSFLKSNVESAPVPKEHIKSEGPFVLADKNKILKVTDRLMASASPLGFGMEITLTGTGDNASIDISLVSNLKSTESVPCSRCNDNNEADISHVIDYRLLKSVLDSFDTDKPIKLHINEDKIFFKVYTSGEVEGNKYIIAGIGSYAKII